MKVIFLDIDGVVITLRSIRNKDMEAKADPAAVAALNRVIKTTGAKIVVSSTWRAYGIGKMRELLTLWGIKGDLFGLTPDLSTMYHGGLYACARAEEIGLWLRLCPAPVESALAIDDDPIEAPQQQWSLGVPLDVVKTGFEEGLTEALADQAIACLVIRCVSCGEELRRNPGFAHSCRARQERRQQ